MTALRRQARDFAVRHVGGAAVVLIYHRVAQLERDPQLLAVSPMRFDAQMAMLAERFNVISLADLASGVRRRQLPAHSVAVTFDDGYADNLLAAEPILAARGIPATVFVSSGYVLSGREFWWDDLERLVLSPGTLPARIELEVAQGAFRATLEDSPTYTEQDAERDRGWSVLDAPTSARHRLYSDLSSFLRPLPPLARHDALEQLRALAGAPDPAARPTHRPLSAAQVAQLDASPVVDVGAHTVHHAVLSALGLEEQRAEIVEDSDALAAICGRAMRVFSYPYGGLDDYSDDTVRLAREAGFSGACSNHTGVVKPWTDPFRLPRNVVRDWSAADLSDKIEGWLRGSL